MNLKNKSMQNPYYCKECSIYFQHSSSYSRHRTSKHSNNIVQNDVCTGAVFICDKCGTSFSRKDSLIRHISGARKCIYYECAYCNEKFHKKSLLIFHIKKEHILKDKRLRLRKGKQFVCVLCGKQFNEEEKILCHFRSIHELNIEEENLKFESSEDFELWVKTIEEEMWCSYNKINKTQWYQCHRSGFYSTKKERMRRASKKGSKKINGYCPSSFKVLTNENGSYEVKFIRTHVGHSVSPTELMYVRFSKKHKNEIALKISSEIPVSRIMWEFREKCDSSGKLTYKHQLVTKKDIENVALAKNLTRGTRRRRNEILGLDSYVMKNKDSILYYKKQWECDFLHPNLRQKDFLLIIMNQRQSKYLTDYGANAIAIDETHGMSPRNFTLYTMLVLDQYEEGYPCCFLITNRHDETVIDIMFSCVKQKCGKIQPSCFMSVAQDYYFNSWVQIMNYTPSFRLFCSWHILEVWNSNVNKVKGKEKKDLTRKTLENLHCEPKIDEFHKKLNTFLNNEDKDLQEFVGYFRTNFQQNVQQWAHCYRLNSGLIAHMCIERFHHAIKYSNGEGCEIAQVPDCLHTLDMFFKNEEHEEKNMLDTKIRIPTKVKNLREAHNRALSILHEVEVRAESDYWNVRSGSGDSYYIYRNQSTCDQKCKIFCDGCQLCSHQYTCSCPENFIKGIMCEHIHLLAMVYLNEIIVINEIQESDDVYYEEIIYNYEDATSPNSEKDSDLMFQAECKKEMERQFNIFLSKIKKFTKEKTKHVTEMFTCMAFTLSAMDEIEIQSDV